jgi:acyl transferase domain-containing protein
VVLEEYVQATMASDTHSPQHFTLSATNQDRLIVYARNMLQFFQTHRNLDLEQVLYTLRTGREEMDAKVSFKVSSWNELLEKLDSYLANPDAFDILSELRDPPGALNSFPGKMLRRVPLPTYPFEKKRHWFSAASPQQTPLVNSQRPLAGIEFLEDLILDQISQVINVSKNELNGHTPYVDFGVDSISGLIFQ